MGAQKSKGRILVVDDEESIVEFIEMGLLAEGYEVYKGYNGYEGLSLAQELKPDIVILDIMLPGIDGYEVCKRIRNSVKTSVIMLTAKDDIDDRVKGLDLGADDYMVKPFSFKELIARINARLRNIYPNENEIIYYGDFNVDDAAHEIKYKGKLLELSPTEYNLLRYLLLNNGIVLSKSNIVSKVWDFDFNGEYNIVEVYIRYLREKIQDSDHSVIRTVRGVGYKVVLNK